jgi:SAM-dependent methyltransferase
VQAVRRVSASPVPFSVITTRELWTDPWVSEQMLRYHLDPTNDLASRRPAVIDATVDWTTSEFSLGPGSSVLDLGCGPGLYTHRWGAGGADVTGVDFSAGSIAYARRAAERDGLRVRYVEADYLDWQAERTFNMVSLIWCDFSALGPAQRAVLLASVASWLAPGGAFLFDVIAPPYVAARQERSVRTDHPDGGFWAAGPYEELLETMIDPDERLVLDRYTVVEPERTRTFWNWFQAYDPSSLDEVLSGAGLRVDAVLGDTTGRSYDPASTEFAVVART